MSLYPPPLPKDWCAYHCCVETPADTDDQTWCGECWHVWSPASLLLDDHNRVLDELGHPGEGREATTWEEVWVCPLCAHDL